MRLTAKDGRKSMVLRPCASDSAAMIGLSRKAPSILKVLTMPAALACRVWRRPVGHHDARRHDGAARTGGSIVLRSLPLGHDPQQNLCAAEEKTERRSLCDTLCLAD